jgi:peptidoglycan/LPS O-acetylase OafA/YrhL
VSVAIHHAAYRTIDPPTRAGAVLHRFDPGVLLFFVISGFLLYRPFVARLHAGRGAVDLGRYALRRAIRIFPPYWLALTVSVYALGVVALPTLGSALAHYTLMHHYFVQYFFDQGLDQSWTLSIELTFYAALPLYAAGVAMFARAAGVAAAEAAGLALVIAIGMACQIATQLHATVPVWVRVLPINRRSSRWGWRSRSRACTTCPRGSSGSDVAPACSPRSPRSASRERWRSSVAPCRSRGRPDNGSGASSWAGSSRSSWSRSPSSGRRTSASCGGSSAIRSSPGWDR